ncbi:hypothetical protein [Aeromicrobium wangtongii]|uniref:Lipoprotein n=1 Tax=Aeromicrobium wangtongii TaxID=2969247 RepID=A0ABY5M997_9ACTN|nr:hypothetical protein [Aeromicrobium wangtongii]MCD9199954.1 hypothetical protein [Aeromicrobium wangtongii]UUP13570.1 hypothetical protein NQV15_17235 [Aeromicrobium wangtongii]
MRRAAALLAATAFALVLTACGSDGTTSPGTSSSAPPQGAAGAENSSKTWDDEESRDRYLAFVEPGNAKLSQLKAVAAEAAGQTVFTAEQLAAINAVCSDLATINDERSEKLTKGKWPDGVRPAIDDLVISRRSDSLAYRKCATAKDTAEITAAVDDLVRANSSARSAVVREALGLPEIPEVAGPTQ